MLKNIPPTPKKGDRITFNSLKKLFKMIKNDCSCSYEISSYLFDKPFNRPKIVCLCGSTRFYEQFQQANYNETMDGNIVLSVGFYPHRLEVHNQTVGCTEEQKIKLDELHKRKIDLADEILVLNIGGYIGNSTKSEIEYAKAHNKSIRYLEDPPVIVKFGNEV